MQKKQCKRFSPQSGGKMAVCLAMCKKISNFTAKFDSKIIKT